MPTQPKDTGIRIELDELAGLLDPDACCAWLVERYHPHGPACPKCGHLLTGRQVETWKALRPVKCQLPKCRAHFRLTTGTPLSGSQMDPCTMLALLILIKAGVSDKEIRKTLGLSRSTLLRWRKRIMKADASRS